VFFTNSGAEASDVRDQARAQATVRRRLRRGRGGFHGRTMGALSATPQETKQAPFAPLVPGFDVGGPRRRGRTGRTP